MLDDQPFLVDSTPFPSQCNRMTNFIFKWNLSPFKLDKCKKGKKKKWKEKESELAALRYEEKVMSLYRRVNDRVTEH